MNIKQQIKNETLKAYIIGQLTNMVKIILEELIKDDHIKSIVIVDTANKIMGRINDKD